MRILNLLFEQEFAVSDVPQNITFNICAILKAKGQQQTSQKLALRTNVGRQFSIMKNSIH